MSRPHEYDLHTIVRIRSAVRLPELEHFRISPTSERADLDVRIVADPSHHGSRQAIRYAEAPGRFGFSIAIDRHESGTVIHASPLLRHSPHVLYTNVVEPVLRWTFVRAGYALLHGACLAFDGRALFITARTDTGKTTTILKTVRADPAACRFLSDDMTLVDARGVARSYPKPLTISRHTVHAIGGAPLTWPERAFLAVQSRLHSKGGRGAGMRIAAAGLPAATLSAVVQRLIRPPKYAIERLVPGAQHGERAQLAAIVVIERGPEATEPMTPAELLPALIANTEDAYGFPPYPKIAAELSTWMGEDLRDQERRIVAAAVSGRPAMRLASDAFAWHERLPDFARGTLPVGTFADERVAVATPFARAGT